MLTARFLRVTGIALALVSAPLSAIIDRNGDGVSDVWADLYRSTSGASADDDGDGQLNAKEAIAGTDPFDPASYFVATPQNKAGGGVSLYWFGVRGKCYQVQASTDLRTWVALGAPQIGYGLKLQLTVRAAGMVGDPRQYWRVVVQDSDTDGDGASDWEELELGTDPAQPNLPGPPLAHRRALAGDPGVAAFRPSAAAGGYYVDSVNGDDLALGTSGAHPWRSLERLNKAVLKPGDIVRLARGSVWNETLVVDTTESGTIDAPIVFDAYGRGAAPVISRTADAIAIDLRGSQIVLLDLVVRGAKTGIQLSSSCRAVVVAGNEIIDTGIGITVKGNGHRILSNYIHDLHMIRNTPEPHDDYGAIGVFMMGEDFEVAWNCLVNCSAPSFDYGRDGGAFEAWYPGTLRRVRIHHNLADNSGIMELTNDVDDLLIAHNLFINCPSLCFHTDDIKDKVFTYKNVRFENNTVFQDSQLTKSMIFAIASRIIGEAQAGHSLTLRNNIIFSPYRLVYNPKVFGAGLVHDHNLFHCVNTGNADVAIPLDATEGTGDPLFVAPASCDFRLQAGSPALGCGVTPFYGYDLQGSVIPAGAKPDLGTYERK